MPSDHAQPADRRSRAADQWLARTLQARALALLILLGGAALSAPNASAEIRLITQRPGRLCPLPNAGFVQTRRVRVCFVQLPEPDAAGVRPGQPTGAATAPAAPGAANPIDPSAYTSNYKRSASQAASRSGSN